MEYSVYSYTAKSKFHINNEDSHFICDDYIIVADGMGGESDGDIASRIAVDSIDSVLSKYIPKVSTEKEIKDLLSAATAKADSKISEYIDDNPDSFGMGTTTLIAVRKNHDLYISWCGDSHCYAYNGEKVASITKDHSYVQQLIDSGHLSVEQSFTHPNNNLITRFVGGGAETCLPDFCTHQSSGSELIILCSDGLSGYCKVEEISRIIRNNRDIKELPRQLSDLAISRGSDDDITIIILVPKTYTSTLRPSNSPLKWLSKIFGNSKK